MSVQRVMGLETEYGVLRPGDVKTTPMVLSGQVVMAYANAVGQNAAQSRWDYRDESPLHDARGYDVAREFAHESQLTDEIDPSFANVVLSNGARLYVDHAHPEYSSPEVLTPHEAIVYDRAGEQVMRRACELLADDPAGPTALYKNNTDGKGASYGTHENYLLKRSTPWRDVVAGLTPFFVTRGIYTGSGRVGIGAESENSGFQLTQRADFFEAEVGLETTLRRPIINTRDEPHADPAKYRRLHVIIGDANHADGANLLKMGSTSLVLGALEDGALPDIHIKHPVGALRRISHDPTFSELMELDDGRHVRALDIIEMYASAVEAWLDQHGDDPVPDATREVMTLWHEVIDGLRHDPMSLSRRLDWVAKLQILEAFRARSGASWDDPRLRALDIQWSDVRPDKGVFATLERAGRFDRFTTDAEIDAAVMEPPATTRAWLRGKSIETYGADVATASWESMVYRSSGRYHRMRMPEPLSGTREQSSTWFNGDIENLLAQMERSGEFS